MTQRTICPHLESSDSSGLKWFSLAFIGYAINRAFSGQHSTWAEAKQCVRSSHREHHNASMSQT